MCSERRKLVKQLEQAGFELDRHGKHPVYKRGKQTIAIPSGTKRLCRPLMMRLLKEAKSDCVSGQ